MLARYANVVHTGHFPNPRFQQYDLNPRALRSNDKHMLALDVEISVDELFYGIHSFEAIGAIQIATAKTKSNQSQNLVG